MPLQVAEIFLDVVAPVFTLVLIGFMAAPRLGLQAKTLSRLSYYILIPAFVFQVFSQAQVEISLAARMVGFMLTVQIGCALLGGIIPWALGRSTTMISAYVLVATFGNVGNFGLPLIEFRLGPEALVPATFFFLVINLSSFVIGVTAANWAKGGSMGATMAVLKTPALLAVPPALLFNWTPLQPPLILTRVTEPLASAMVPVMLVALGVQLASTRTFAIDRDVILSSGIRLLASPLLAFALVGLFGLHGLERGAGIVQAAMPAAILTAIIAIEYELIPEFVTRVVLFSTIASLVTLTFILSIV
jgi:predicted permease